MTSGQLFSAQTKEDQKSHAQTDLFTIMIALSKFILDYAELFEEVTDVLQKFPEAYSLAQKTLLEMMNQLE